MIRRAKKTWIHRFIFYNPFEQIWFKSVFNLENYGFWKCDFNKICWYLCNKGHEFVIKIYLYLTWNVKLGIQNTKFEHKNDICHVQSLDKDFYLGAPNSFYHVFTLVLFKPQIPLHFTLFYETSSCSTFWNPNITTSFIFSNISMSFFMFHYVKPNFHLPIHLF